MSLKKTLGLILLICSMVGLFIFYYFYSAPQIKIGGQKKTETIEKMPGIKIKPLPYKKNNTSYNAKAKSIKAIDLGTNYSFLEKNANQKLPVASLTKIMTALVVMENANRNEVVTVPNLNMEAGEARMGLFFGEKIKVEELLKGVLVHSAGDAAETLAIHVGGSEEKFVAMMNKKSKDLVLKDTHFENPVGLDGPKNYSTANDLTNLTRLLLNNKDFREIIKLPNYTAKNEAGKTYFLNSTNKILDGSKIFGVKTGYTFQAGECLITLARENNHEVLTVVIGSSDRFAETRSLINWIYANYGW